MPPEVINSPDEWPLAKLLVFASFLRPDQVLNLLVPVELDEENWMRLALDELHRKGVLFVLDQGSISVTVRIKQPDNPEFIAILRKAIEMEIFSSPARRHGVMTTWQRTFGKVKQFGAPLRMRHLVNLRALPRELFLWLDEETHRGVFKALEGCSIAYTPHLNGVLDVRLLEVNGRILSQFKEDPLSPGVFETWAAYEQYRRQMGLQWQQTYKMPLILLSPIARRGGDPFIVGFLPALPHERAFLPHLGRYLQEGDKIRVGKETIYRVKSFVHTKTGWHATVNFSDAELSAPVLSVA